MNAVTYLRVSGNAQLDGGGFDRQAEKCNALAADKGFQVARAFEEKAIPGWKDEDERPAFKEMVTFLLDTGTKIVIVEGLDRLARAYRIQEQLLFYLAAKGLTLYAANTGENITEAMMGDPMKVAMVQMQGVFAQLDKSMTVAKLRNGRRRVKTIKGRCEGQKPFGHYPGEEYALTVLRELSTGSAWTCQEIAANLNNRGIPTRSGRPWSAPVIAKILRRERLVTQTCASLAL